MSYVLQSYTNTSQTANDLREAVGIPAMLQTLTTMLENEASISKKISIASRYNTVIDMGNVVYNFYEMLKQDMSDQEAWDEAVRQMTSIAETRRKLLSIN
jgi:hypothetical protein